MKLVFQGNWFHRETGFAEKLGKLVWQENWGNWFRRETGETGETGFVGKLGNWGNWFRRETCFLLPLQKYLSLYLWWNKLLSYNAKVSDITKQMAVIDKKKKKTRKMSQGSWEWNIQLQSTIIQKNV